MKKHSIQSVIDELEIVIEDCINRNCRTGYFAVLYHRVTCRIKEGIDNNEFEDNERMERLDVLFAKRYLDAWHKWQKNENITSSWEIAFNAAEKNNAIILQHLLLGINAHINLDLGIAAAETMQGYNLHDVQKDFNLINNILAALVDEVQDNIGQVSPFMLLLDLFAKKHDEMLVAFSINTARNGAWLFANELYAKMNEGYETCIMTRDEQITLLAKAIATPQSKFFSLLLKVVGFFEWTRPKDVIKTFRHVAKVTLNKTPVKPSATPIV